MYAKAEIGDRLPLFVPDIGGPRALPTTTTSRCCLTGGCARCLRGRLPRWSR